jgi:hypothetical protein
MWLLGFRQPHRVGNARRTEVVLPGWASRFIMDDDRDVDLEDLLADDGGDSAALARWKDRLSRYVDSQGGLDALRLRSPSEPPWPASDNPMLAYLSERSREIASEDGVDSALAWIIRHAWFEGAISERARITRLVDAD